MRSSSPALGESQFSILIDLVGAGQLLEFARLREIAMHQLQVLGLFQSFVAVGSLVAVGDHVAGQRGQHIVGLRVAGDGRHAAERAQGPGYLDIRLVAGRIAGRRGRKGGGTWGHSAGALVDLQGAQRTGAVTLEEGQFGHTPRHRGALAALGGLIQRGQELGVGFHGGRIGVAVEELRVFG